MLTLQQRIINKQIKNVLRLYKHKHDKKSLSNFIKYESTSAKVHTSAGLQVRIFKDTENLYAYNILQSTPAFPKDLHRYVEITPSICRESEFNEVLNQDWRSKSANEITDCFKRVVNYCIENNIDVSDSRFDKLVDGLMDHVQDLTDGNLSDLLTCLQRLPACDSYTSHNFHDLWSALDDVCCWRATNWSVDTLFLFAEHWYRLNLAKLSDYMSIFIDRTFRRIQNLNKTHLLHLLFYVKCHKRKRPPFESQSALDKYIKEMTIDEIAVASMAFVRFEHTIKLPTTAVVIVHKAKEALPYASNICLNVVLHLCNYSVRFVEKMVGKAGSLTKMHLIHLFFYINVCRKRYVDFHFESVVEKHVDTLSADEMAIVAMGFFKSQTPIRVKLILCTMMEQLKAEMASSHEITITAILKVLRYSSHALLVDQLSDLLDHLVPEIDRLSNVCCIHAALLGTTLQFYHTSSLDKITRKIEAEITDVDAVRLKDMERLLLTLTMFDVESSIYKNVYEEIHKDSRRKEFVKYPRCLPSVLNFLSLRNMYSDGLMDEVLDKEHVLENYGKHAKNLSRDLFSLDVCIEVERPEYVGNRLDPVFRRKVAKWKVEYAPTWNQQKKLTTADRFVLDVTDTVAKIVNGHRNLLTQHVLPNYVKSDIIICKDSNGYFQQPTGFDRYVLGDVMRPMRSDWRWFSIVPVNWNACIRNTTKPLGLVRMKLRQLQAIGYTPVLVIWNEFLPLGEKERLDYVRNKIL